jgi:hypothetical protein
VVRSLRDRILLGVGAQAIAEARPSGSERVAAWTPALIAVSGASRGAVVAR